MEITYRELPAQDVSANRCSVMLRNQMQCPERATYTLVSVTGAKVGQKFNAISHVCKHHYSLAEQLDTENNYVIREIPNAVGADIHEYRPPQK